MGLLDSHAPIWLPIGIEGQRVVILAAEEEVHTGTRYTCLDKRTIQSGSVATVCITPNTSHELHLTVSLETTKSGTWMMSEGASISSGSMLASFNNNRKSANVCHCSIIGNPTVTTVGTVIGYHVLGSATGGASKSGGTSGERNEWILAQNTTYLFQFTATGNDCEVVQGLYFYEEVN